MMKALVHLLVLSAISYRHHVKGLETPRNAVHQSSQRLLRRIWRSRREAATTTSATSTTVGRHYYHHQHQHQQHIPKNVPYTNIPTRSMSLHHRMMTSYDGELMIPNEDEEDQSTTIIIGTPEENEEETNTSKRSTSLSAITKRRLDRIISKFSSKLSKEEIINRVRNSKNNAISDLTISLRGGAESGGGETGSSGGTRNYLFDSMEWPTSLLSPYFSSSTSTNMEKNDIMESIISSFQRNRTRHWNNNTLEQRDYDLDTNVNNGNDEMPFMDRVVGRSFSILTGVTAALQSMGSIISDNDYALFDEIVSKMMSTETAGAIKTIRRILTTFPDHGVIDVLSLYPTKDVIMSVVCLSRLQHAASAYASLKEKEEVRSFTNSAYDLFSLVWKQENTKNDLNDMDDIIDEVRSDKNDANRDAMNDIEHERELLYDIAHYAVFANAAYGWAMSILSGKLYMNDLTTVLSKTGVKPENVIATNWKAKTHLPAYFIVRDEARRKIVLCIRGTKSAKDILTDLCCTAEDFNTKDSDSEFMSFGILQDKTCRAHHGMVEAARGVSKATRKIIASELAADPTYDLVLVGHSLGGGTAAVLANLWEDTFPGLMAYGYGVPCVGPLGSCPTVNKNIISVVGENDPFSCLSLGHLADLSAAISKICEDYELRNEIFLRTQSYSNEDLHDEDLIWCYETMEKLRKEVMNAEKLFPPGRVLLMGGNLFGGNDDVTLKEVKHDIFGELKLHARMFDLSRHLPHRYETVLSILNNMS